ncbi:fumarylacetoacetate hydrolase family protein [Candidatus Nitronereus thalassa]|uniref:Fumarylacetoacetate hydrolase family protein n=1 Tax=Candidatus Nitronereus thalassa TaxID=3020898 RepID=A0ABU3K4J1_9BACT|nr:fumarylacetoacetate hydrolase family protein [Candidatus Nitronereus thalassa]MDT7041289.1 fumarylacetoacetate hydrolase family protein [Candidatus Nitronereus thalassa]
MKLLRYETTSGSTAHGLLIEKDIFPLIEMTTTEALGKLKQGNPHWKKCVAQTPVALSEVTLLPPVERPGAFLDFYTFEDHVRTARKKRGLDIVPEWYEYPVWYNGSPRCFSGDGTTVHFPKHEHKKDYELELGIVIHKPCHRISVEEAAEHIGAYTIVNDFSARQLQEKIMKVGLGPAKAKDFNTGLGPWLVTPDEIRDPRNLNMRAWVNGELWSEGNSGSSHFTFAQMIAFASEDQTLYPGDILASGTVGTGCGLELDRFLQSGDKVELEIEHIGRLTHWVG